MIALVNPESCEILSYERKVNTGKEDPERNSGVPSFGSSQPICERRVPQISAHDGQKPVTMTVFASRFYQEAKTGSDGKADNLSQKTLEPRSKIWTEFREHYECSSIAPEPVPERSFVSSILRRPAIQKTIEILSNFRIDIASFEELVKTFKLVELSYWKYLDTYVRQDKNSFPNMSFKNFLQAMLQVKRINWSREIFEGCCTTYNRYKKSIPTAGGVILSHSKILLVRVYESSVFSFPKGKMEAGESYDQTAVREIYEETGLDLSANLDPEAYHDVYRTRLYYFNLPECTKSVPINDREIVELRWIPIRDVSTHPELFSRQVKIYVNTYFGA
ncbi:MAG: NUDIX domain-containing protein [Sulfobacillus sp.]